MRTHTFGNPLLLLIFLVSAASAPTFVAKRLRTQNPARQTKNFNGGWLFYRGDIQEDAAKNPSFLDKNWQKVHLPHCPDILPLRHPWKPDNEGINWYRKHFSLPEGDRGKKIIVEFEAADQVAEVWVNGVLRTTHQGPYLPFFVDMTDGALFGDSPNAIAVKVSNAVDRDIPSYGNWISYGGLYRDVVLHVTDRLHITDAVQSGQAAGGGVFVTYPEITDSSACIDVKTQVANEHPASKTCTLRTSLVDAENRLMAAIETGQTIGSNNSHAFTQQLRLADPHLWHPNHPYLYRLCSEILDNGVVKDRLETRIGIRRIQFSHDDGFSINGERFLFMGTNRVQDYPYVSWAFPNLAHRRDAVLLKEGGFQYVRSSHNPQDPSFLDACDELGILLMDCIPGFQFIGGPRFREQSFQTMRDMIRRDRNHPSVILWELSLNETDYDSSFARTAMQIGHEEFPGDQCFVAGWKFPSIYDVFLRATQHGARDDAGPAPLVISEYGHWEFGGGRSTSDVDRKKGEETMLAQAQNHILSLSANRGLSFLCGDGLWVGMDFQCYPSRVIDYFRIPKFSYSFYQSQRDPSLILPGIDSGPMVFIANFWTEHSPRTVTVFSNLERVDLFVNGEKMASQKPDTGFSTRNLLHPPFTFADIPWKPGTLKAVGFLDGKEAASFTRMTPGPPSRIDLRTNLKGVATADAEDLFFVYASVVDENGTVAGDPERDIAFRVSGPGILVGPEHVVTEAGTAAALVRTTTQSGRIVVRAESLGLKEAVLSIQSTKE